MTILLQPNRSISELYKDELLYNNSDLTHISDIRRKFLEYCRDNPDADECRVYED